MTVAKYRHGAHYEMLRGWLAARNLQIPSQDLFSDCGFCVQNRAIGFLFKTNSKQAYIDHVAADPNCTSDERNSALNLLFDVLLDEAKSGGVRLVTALATLPAMKARFENLLFKPYGNFTLYYKVME